MGYCHVHLMPNANRLCTIVMPWGKHEYARLPMGMCNDQDIFQEHTSELMAGLEFTRVHIFDLLMIAKSNFKDHLQKLEKVFFRVQEANLRINAEKSFFAKPEAEHSGFHVNGKGIMPIAKKAEAIQAIQPPKTRNELRKFTGIINYHRDMWPRRSSISKSQILMDRCQTTHF